MALSSAQLGLIIAAVSRETPLRDWSWSMALLPLGKDHVGTHPLPPGFHSKRQLWTYSRLGVETHDSAQHRYVDGQLQRSKKPQQIRGLNQNHSHEMKGIFKSTAMSASRCAGPLQDFYAGLLAKGMKPDMARLTLARKIAAITLTLWKTGERFDAEHLKSQAA